MARIATLLNSSRNVYAQGIARASICMSKRQMHLSRFLVKPSELQTALENATPHERPIIPLSAAWFLPNDPEKRTGWSSFTARRIPASRFFDLDQIKDVSSPYPHMLPDSNTFADAMGRLGIERDDTVVVYDTAELGIFSAPRVAWTLRVYGHPRVHLLNNFKIWVEQGRPTESGEPTQHVNHVSYNMPQLWSVKNHVTTFEEMQQEVKAQGSGSKGSTVVDARPAGRWHGTSPEPRAGMPSGHMPGSISLPFSDVLDPKTKAILPSDHLEKVLESKRISKDDRIISSCGTGVTAAVVDIAMEEAGRENRRIYDGSWTEWASRVKPEEGWIHTTSNNEAQ